MMSGFLAFGLRIFSRVLSLLILFYVFGSLGTAAYSAVAEFYKAWYHKAVHPESIGR